MLKIVKKYWLWVILILIFWGRGIIYLDPDFGWHLTAGRLILTKGIPVYDPFSYTMANFKFVDHEWLTNVAIAKLFPVVGSIGLSLIWAVMAVAALKISISRVKGLENLRFYAILLAAGILLEFFGIRPQVITWLFLAVLLWIFQNWEKLKYKYYFLPPFFLLWANFHGGFAIGVVLLPLYLGLKSYATKKIVWSDWLITAVSVLVTLVNPYGLALWQEVVVNFFGNSLRWQIAEWLPGLTALIFCLPALGVFGPSFLWRYRREFSLPDLVLNFLFLAMAISTIRNIPLFTVSIIPFLVWGASYLGKSVARIKYGPARFKKAVVIISIIASVLFLADAALSYRGGVFMSESNFYPKAAVAYLAENLPQGQIFSEYGWGGYLIWRLPQKKTFIDGRMSHWPGILTEYTQIAQGKRDYQPVFEEFQIDTVLWPVAREKVALIKDLREAGWQEVYRDKVTEILVKNK